MNKRITYIDTAKGILILLMLIGHIWNTGYVHDFIYVFHMPAFFILSGMTAKPMGISLQGFVKYFAARFRKLLIPYLFFEIYAIFVDIICNGAYLNIKGYAYQILTLRLFNGPLWFLMVMLISGMAFYFLQGLKHRKAVYATILFLLAVAMVMPQFRAYISPSTVTLALLYMLEGFYMRTLFEKVSTGGRWLLMLLGVTVLISLTEIGEMPNYQSGSRVLFLLGSVCGTAFILALSKRADHAVFCFFGQNSLVILGSHYPLIRLTKHFFQFEEFSLWGGILFFILLVPIEVLIILFVRRFLPFATGKSVRMRKPREVVK